jgi:hypothetical protein
MRRAILLLAVAACAPAKTPPGEEVTPRQAAIFTDPSTGTLLADAPRSVGIDLAAPPASVWTAVKKVYADLDIPVTVENPSAHQIGNPNFFKSRQLAGQSMVQFVDCGSGMTGPKAASYRIYMSLLTTVMPDGKGGTNIQTTFAPMGQDMSGTSSDKIPCGSSGRFEALVLDHVKTAVGR